MSPNCKISRDMAVSALVQFRREHWRMCFLPGEGRRLERVSARVIAEIGLACVGIPLLGTAIAANQRYLDQHLLPSFLLPNRWYVTLETLARACMVVAGALFLFVLRPYAGRFAARAPARSMQIVVAVLLAIGV